MITNAFNAYSNSRIMIHTPKGLCVCDSLQYSMEILFTWYIDIYPCLQGKFHCEKRGPSSETISCSIRITKK